MENLDVIYGKNSVMEALIAGEREINKILISIFIIISTVLVMAISYFVVNCIIKYSAEVNKELTNDELNELGIEPNMESLSDKEIDDIWNEVLSDSNNKVQ